METGSVINQYKIISPIGKGGMGEVFLAEDTKLDRKVAIKFLNPEFSKDVDKLSRFIQEAKAVSALNHPNILTVFEIGEVDEANFIVTEFIEGKTLRDSLSPKQTISLNQILKIGVQVAEALSAAHQAGIIHRDVKPENIMIRKDGYAKVLDFGLAKLTEKRGTRGEERAGEDEATLLKGEIQNPKSKIQNLTAPGMVMGTVSYMSPEQARGKETDARTDIWSLGVVLYEMLAGRLPFSGETVNHTIVAILETEPKLLENVPDEMQRIVRKTLTKDKEMRYQTARDLLIDLKNLRRNLDIQGELERSAVPNRETFNALTENATQMLSGGESTFGGQDAATQNVTTSSSNLEYAVTQAKSHKAATAVISLFVVIVISVAVYFGFLAKSGGTRQIESIAVMPFVNEGKNEEVEYLSDGMTETLIGSLSKLPNLNVKPSSSVFRYKGLKTDAKTIGQELNVDAVLNGRIVQRGEELTLSLELVDVQKDAVLWSERYVRKQSDLVSLQSEIAKDVSSRLKTRLTGAEAEKIAKSYTANAEAYRDYLQGRYYWNKRDGANLRKAIEQFKAATEKDPQYALAYVGLADSYAVFPWWDDDFPVDSLSRARQFAKRAIEIDDSLGEAHASLAYVNLYSWNWAESEKEFLRAIELSPDYANAHRWYHEYLITQGRVDEATLTLKKSYELEPLSVIVNYNLATHYCRDKLDPESAIEFAKRVEDLDPNFPGGPNLMGCVYLQQGRNADALAEAKKAVELTNGKIRRFIANLGVAYAKNGQTENAKAIIKDLEAAYAKENSVGVQIAEVYAALGNKDKAFEWIEKDVDNRGFELVLQFRRIAKFGSLTNDKRYAAILKRMGLPK